MTADADESPIDHPSLAKYPASPTHLARVDGELYRVPTFRDRDEAVPVPVSDLVQARTAAFQFAKLLEERTVSDEQARWIGEVLVHTTEDSCPQTRRELVTYLKGLSSRLNGSLPYW